MTTICHLSSVHIRDDARILHKECQSLAAAGYAVNLIVADGGGNEKIGAVTVYDVGVNPRGRLGRMLVSTLRVMWRGLGTRAKLFHFHDSELIPVGILIRFLGYRVIYDVHEDVGRSLDNRPWVQPRLKAAVVRTIDAVEFVAAQVFDAHLIVTPEIARRFPALKTALLRNFPILGEVGRDQGDLVSSRAPLFAYVGTVSVDRGALMMVRAINHPTLARRARLAIGGKIAPPLRAEMEALDTGGLVDFLGYLRRPDVADLLSRARAGVVLLQPIKAHMDAYPVKLFEYMAAGLPVIASDYPLWRELLAHGRLAKMVDATSPGLVAQAMCEMLDDTALVDRLAIEGKRAAATRYNWRSEKRTLIATYEHLLTDTVH